ncbi:MAG: PQQ-dependent sugar dehydrogenase, partial [Bacteroidota bacterium]
MKLVLLTTLIGFLLCLGNEGVFQASSSSSSPEQNYKTYCAGCHGENLEAFIDRSWVYGNSKAALAKGIKNGYPNEGMPAFDTTFTKQEVEALAQYIRRGIQKREQANETTTKRKHIYQSDDLKYQAVLVAEGLNVPWGLAFLPKQELLITDQNGTLYRLSTDKKLHKIKAVPEVLHRGQGGLMDVELHPDFDNNQLIYLSYSKFKREGGRVLSTTAILRAKLKNDVLSEVQEIFEADPYLPTRRHYGSRLEFDKEGFLYFSVGDRGFRDRNPQFLNNDCGKIHRLKADGRIPKDNPFYGQEGKQASIYSYGHRNPQGLTMHPKSGQIWIHEHGPRGGDEVNIIQKGSNYGWPVISYGINYNGTTFTNLTEKKGMEQPLLYWVPSIAPCGMDFIEGEVYPEWQ